MITMPIPHRTAARLAALALLALAPMLAGCGDDGADASPAGLETVEVERVDLVSSVAATGTVEPIRVIDVKSQASGEILEVAVEIGDAVRRGDLLVRIDPRDVRNAYEQAEADLGVAEARFQVAERQMNRIQELHDSSVVTDEELENAMLEHANARAALVKARTNLELARERLNDVVVRAPIDGVVVEKSVEDGQIVTSTREVTGGTTLVRMADLEAMQVRTLVDETDIGRVHAGLPAKTTVEAYPDREFQGEVFKIEPQAVVEQNVTMFAVLSRIQNEGGLLKPGMNADVEMTVGRRENALSLPNQAVKTPEEAQALATVLDMELPEALPAEDAAGGADGAEPDAETGEDDLPDPARLRSMSPDERREIFENLSPAQRQRLMQRAREMREASRAAQRSDPGRPKPGYVFVRGPEGALSLQPVRIGLSTWERTAILAGLEEGDQVVVVPQALVQQRELLERIRGSNQVPGMQRSD